MKDNSPVVEFSVNRLLSLLAKLPSKAQEVAPVVVSVVTGVVPSSTSKDKAPV